jgi:hypothetical protein
MIMRHPRTRMTPGHIQSKKKKHSERVRELHHDYLRLHQEDELIAKPVR